MECLNCGTTFVGDPDIDSFCGTNCAFDYQEKLRAVAQHDHYNPPSVEEPWYKNERLVYDQDRYYL